MSRTTGRVLPPENTRFPKGVSGNPGGRPRKNSREASPFAVLNNAVSVRHSGQEHAMTTSDVADLKLVQQALAGKRRAWKAVLAMMAAREEVRARQRPPTDTRQLMVWEDSSPTDADEPLVLLGLVEYVPRQYEPENREPSWRLRPWAVQLALSRRSLGELTREDMATIEAWTTKPAALRWPRRHGHDR